MLNIYNLCWFFLTAFLLPLTINKDRFRKRWGIQLPKRSLHKGIWIHALSVGEVLSAFPLIEAISSECSKEIGVTVTTQKGMEIASSRLKDKMLGFFPFDFFWSVKRFVQHIDPSCFILIETDIWPFLLNFLCSNGIKCFLVNGRISPVTYQRYLRFPSLIRKLFDCFELCMMQSEEDKSRLISLGINEKKVVNTGNIKFDRYIEPMSEKEKKSWKSLYGIDNKMIWIAGSTHSGEEEILLRVFKRIKKVYPELALIIAPRNTERTYEVYNMARKMGFESALRSQPPSGGKKDVILLDTVGELARLYSMADIAFVGGSLIPFGGHNLIEPAVFGCLVLFGPHTFNFRDISSALIKNNAGIMVSNEEELYHSICTFIEKPSWRKQIKNSCLEFVRKNRGATLKVISLIKAKLTC